MRAIFKMLLADCAASTNSRSLPANHTQANIDFPNVYETWLRNVFDLAWGIVSIVVVVHCVLSYCSIVCRRIFWLAANRELKSKMYTLEMRSQNAIGNIRFGNRIYTKCVDLHKQILLAFEHPECFYVLVYLLAHSQRLDVKMAKVSLENCMHFCRLYLV